MHLQRPAHHLRPFISHYWISRDNASAVHPILPDCCVDVVFEIGNTVGSRVYGAATRKSACEIALGYHYLGICFLPGRSRHFLNVPAVHLTDDNMEIGTPAGLRPESLADDIEFEAIFHSLDTALSSWLARQPIAVDWVDQALDTLDRHNGNIRIAALARELGLSRRQVERRFLDTVGVPPKTYAGIRRWQQALTLLRAQPTLPLSAVALNSGYTDQSHMNRDFQRLLGLTPGSVADVAFFQDAILPS